QEKAGAQEKTILKIATLAPNGSAWMKVFSAWGKTLEKDTGGRLRLQFYPGGVAGKEKDVLGKIQAGQLDGAAVTASGLSQVVKPILVLQVPGLFTDYPQLDKIRRELASEFEKQCEDAGYELLGWGDAGKTRLFSTRPILHPQDLKKARPWAWREDSVFTEFLRASGATPVRLDVPEVYPALQKHTVDTVPASALAAVSLQWFTRLTHVTKQTISIVIGATLIKKDRIESLPEDLRAALRTTSERAHE